MNLESFKFSFEIKKIETLNKTTFSSIKMLNFNFLLDVKFAEIMSTISPNES